jgi:hypothetical protein
MINSFPVEDVNNIILESVTTNKDPIICEHGTYVGEIKDGKLHGKGVMTYNKNAVDKNATYEGEWKENKRHGKGKITYEDGKIYEGEWKEDKRHGDGTMSYRDSSAGFHIKATFGIWKNDKFEERKKTWFASGEIYEGSFTPLHIYNAQKLIDCGK